MHTIIEVLDYGPIIAKDEDFGYLVTVNGAYFNLWANQGDNLYKNIDVMAVNNNSKGLYGLEITAIMSTAENWLQRLKAEYVQSSAEYLEKR